MMNMDEMFSQYWPNDNSMWFENRLSYKSSRHIFYKTSKVFDNSAKTNHVITVLKHLYINIL